MFSVKDSRIFVKLGLFFLTAFALLTCETPMGLGDPIDWEPPVLEIMPRPPNPYYIGLNAEPLRGTVRDNIGVDRVIMRRAGSADIWKTAHLNGNNWEIPLNFFTQADNGEKITIEIVAFDRMGNTGEMSVAPVTLIIDIGPPIVEDLWIERTNTKSAYLEEWNSLKQLEIDDRLGENSAYVNHYQNGWFTVKGKVREDETRIEIVSLNIYDERRPDVKLLELPLAPGSSEFTPQWLIQEEAILAAGDALISPDYSSRYYSGERYYYRVNIAAIDRSRNPNSYLPTLRIEEKGFFCLWEKSDVPKGIIDPAVGMVVTAGATLPIEFFDDDELDWAYAALFTKSQWEGTKIDPNTGLQLSEYVDTGSSLQIPGGSLPAGDSDADKIQRDILNESKINWLKQKIVDENRDVYDWNLINYNATAVPIIDLIGGKSVDEKTYYIQTGTNADDYGDFYLLTITADKKLPPHSGSGSYNTNKRRWRGRVWHVEVIDDNKPLIVIDVVNTKINYDSSKHPGYDSEPSIRTGDSPEENTFPKLESGQYFTINGYTLRGSKVGAVPNTIEKFRIAWIPYNMPGGADSYITQVQNALKSPSYNSAPFTGTLSGVQHWDFDIVENTYPADQRGKLITGDSETMGESVYKKQVFRKKFDILGQDTSIDEKGYNHFHYNGSLENETKLFVFFAEDNMGHQVFRQYRLLGWKKPPEIIIYDISASINNNDNQPLLGGQNIIGNIPDFSKSQYDGKIENPLYVADIKGYNTRTDVYNLLKNAANRIETQPFQIYSKNAVLKYWVKAETPEGGEIAVDTIKMEDVTYEAPVYPEVGSNYNSSDRALSFIEYYPDEVQKVFLFTATDKLGNVATKQRTIAVTNTARLESITTTSPSGSYGIGQVITIRANFSGLIKYETAKPELNIRYPMNDGTVRHVQIPCETSADQRLYLEFKFTVPEDAKGQLVTMYDGIPGSPASGESRPLLLSNGAKIIDVIRTQAAFVPGYTDQDTGASYPNWDNAANSLQDPVKGKDIQLDGVKPRITATAVGGKTAYSDGYHYFRTNDTITFTLSTGNQATDKNIRPKDPANPPRLQYYIRETPLSTPQGQRRGPYNADFVYQRPDGNKSLVFTLPVNNNNCPYDGQIVDISLFNTGSIVDDLGNEIVGSTVTELLNLTANRIYIKKSIPSAPVSQLNGTAFTSAAAVYNGSVNLTINGSNAALSAWEDTIQYSVNGGNTWNTWNSSVSIGGAIGLNTYEIRTRYLDRAGNEGAQAGKRITINGTFPKLLGISAGQPPDSYKIGSRTIANPLKFTLDFEDDVTVDNAANVTITLKDRTNSSANNIITLRASDAANSRTLTFAWPNNVNITGEQAAFTDKDMLNGLIVTSINLSGLKDRYGNSGYGSGSITCASAATDTVVISSNSTNITYNLRGTIVSTITPAILTDGTGYSPSNAKGITGNRTASVSGDNKTITLKFNKPVQAGSGTIVVRPYSGSEGSYSVPPVFENEGYYITVAWNAGGVQSENRSAQWTANSTYVWGFTDVFNNTNNTGKSALIGSTDMSNPALSSFTGLSTGHYKRTTHGLIEGPGFTGNYTGSDLAGSAANNNYMIPDTSTKWVLGYEHLINPAATDAAITAIRAALDEAKFRWQEFSVTSASNVSFAPGLNNTSGTVTITLNEPLLPGLRWELYYDTGTFTDMAGNQAAVLPRDTYMFWSKGIQKPVVRVDRKSYDARTTAPIGDIDTSIAPVAQAYVANGSNGTIASFDTINYRIESETPGARIYYNTQTGAVNTGSITGAWENVSGGIQWSGPKAAATTTVTSTWVNTNLIFRQGRTQGTTPASYQVYENGNLITRNLAGDQNFYGFRSFNKDATVTELSTTALTNGFTQPVSASFTYSALQASKNYVVADARIDHVNGANFAAAFTSQRGYEGVFRTVIMINQTGAPTNAQGQGAQVNNVSILLTGSNTLGTPTIAGFPVRLGYAYGDTRYYKVFHRVMDGNTQTNRYYWVSSEIVSQWYMESFGSGRTSTGQGQNRQNRNSRTGDHEAFLTSGYGDLSYTFQIDAWTASGQGQDGINWTSFTP